MAHNCSLTAGTLCPVSVVDGGEVVMRSEFARIPGPVTAELADTAACPCDANVP